MVGFVIPFRPKANSKDWNKDQLLLTRTINSILNQTIDQFKIFVIYTDLPNLNLSKKTGQLTLLEFPYSYMKYECMILNDYNRKHSEKWLERNTDKARKTMFGCISAKAAGCSYIMQIDSDDLISNNIVEYVVNNYGKPGWFINKGYIYYEAKKLLIKQPQNMNYLNGSTHIIRQDLVPVTDLGSNEVNKFYFYAAHGYLKDRIKHLYELELQPLPFYANIYVISGINQSAVNELLSIKNLKNFIKIIFRFTFLTKSIKTRFGLYTFHA